MKPSERLDKARTCRIGIDGYCCILAYLSRTAKTSAQVAEHMDINIQTARFMLRWMLRLKIIHRPQWVRATPHSRMVPKWRLGADGDTTCPDREDSGPQRKLASGLILLGTTIELLRSEAMTLGELAAELAMCEETASRLVKLLRKHGLCHIKSWIKPPVGVTVAQHVFGAGTDAQRPARLCEVASAKRHRATHRAKRQHLMLIHAMAGPANQEHVEVAA